MIVTRPHDYGILLTMVRRLLLGVHHKKLFTRRFKELMKTNTLNDLPDPTGPQALEKHYTVANIAAAWALSCATVRRYFENLPGVIQIGHAANKSKRRYVTLRIPSSVLHAEHGRMTRRA